MNAYSTYIDWSRAGSAGHIIEQLTEIRDHMSARDAAWAAARDARAAAWAAQSEALGAMLRTGGER